MSCDLAQTAVHGYFDGELDAVGAAEFERHLENCRDCQESLEHMRSLRVALRQSDLYHRASARLRDQIRRRLKLQGTEPSAIARFGRRSFLALVLTPVSVAAALAIALLVVRPGIQTTRVTAELIDAHVRSLQPGHLTDVQSTDQHTVKPWFDGKLDFIPPVADYSAQGFELVGGRLDVVDGHNVAALVYGRRKHTISFFAWPARDSHGLSAMSGSRHGYNWSTWQSGDMQYCLVSDVSAADIGELKGLINR
ncbi:MAG: anti-sigma factor [Acidobacteria bacterium]|nr:anti-sigma factor [Acidobacteriota bacterium]